jgi:hypothetical protein
LDSIYQEAKIVRMQDDDGERIVGVRVPSELMQKVTTAISTIQKASKNGNAKGKASGSKISQVVSSVGTGAAITKACLLQSGLWEDLGDKALHLDCEGDSSLCQSKGKGKSRSKRKSGQQGQQRAQKRQMRGSTDESDPESFTFSSSGDSASGTDHDSCTADEAKAEVVQSTMGPTASAAAVVGAVAVAAAVCSPDETESERGDGNEVEEEVGNQEKNVNNDLRTADAVEYWDSHTLDQDRADRGE